MKILTVLITTFFVLLISAQSSGSLSEKIQAYARSRWAFLGDPDVFFYPTPLITQGKNANCAPAVVASVLLNFGDNFREAQLEKELNTSNEEGTSYKSIKKFVLNTLNNPQKKEKALLSAGVGEKVDPQAEVSAHIDLKTPYEIEVFPGESQQLTSKLLRKDLGEEMVPVDGLTLNRLEAFVRAKKPVVVTFQAWGTGGLSWEESWDSGHFAVVVGYDKENLFFMDPFLKGTWGKISKKEFLSRWHDIDVEVLPDGRKITSRMKHMAIVFSRNVPTFKFFEGPVPNIE